jgi:hypothetical protein
MKQKKNETKKNETEEEEEEEKEEEEEEEAHAKRRNAIASADQAAPQSCGLTYRPSTSAKPSWLALKTVLRRPASSSSLAMVTRRSSGYLSTHTHTNKEWKAKDKRKRKKASS